MGSVQDKLRETIARAAEVDVDKVKLEHPEVEEHGDYSTNIALVLKGGNQLAEKIVQSITQDTLIAKAEVAGPGFINIWLQSEFLISEIDQVLTQAQDYGKGVSTLTIGVEHTGPNTNKPLHIGHLRNTILGMAIVRIMNFSGRKTLSWNINNDRGIHIVKSMWAYMKYGRGLNPEEITKEIWSEIQSEAGYSGKFDHVYSTKPDYTVGMFYVLGANKYEDSEEVQKEMGEMLLSWEHGDVEVRRVWKTMNNWFYIGSGETLKRLGTYFDREWYESDIYDKGKAVVDLALRAGKLNKAEDGHVEANLEEYKLPNIVLLRQNGTSLYITQDIELARQRIQEEKVDKLWYLTSSEQNLRFQQLFRVCEMVGAANYDQLGHLGYGMVRLADKKMSSRAGTVITADGLLDEVRGNTTAEEIAVGAVKYGMLRYAPLSDIVFDIESVASTTGNSGPYLQYTHARIMSVTKNASATKLDTNYKMNNDEEKVVKMIYKFGEVVEESASRLAPNLLCNYLYELAQRYNAFYNSSSILKADTSEQVNFRLNLSRTVAQILKNGLGLLGITAPDTM